MTAGVKNGSGLFSKKSTLKPHLTAMGGLGGEINDLRQDVNNEMKAMVALTVDEFTDGVAASANAIKTAIATVAAPTTYVVADLNGTTGAAVMVPPRNITITTAGGTAADAPATATINGTFRGKAQTDTITVAQTATIATGVKPFDKVTSIVLPAADGTGATLAFGFGLGYGTGKTPKSRAGGVVLVREQIDGALVTTGAITANSLYTPATAPDGAHDWAIFYEYDPTV